MAISCLFALKLALVSLYKMRDYYYLSTTLITGNTGLLILPKSMRPK